MGACPTRPVRGRERSRRAPADTWAAWSPRANNNPPTIFLNETPPHTEAARRRDQLAGDRPVAALEVPALRGAPQVGGLEVGADLVGQLAGRVVEALQHLGRGTAAHVAAGDEGRQMRDVDDLHAAGTVI